MKNETKQYKPTAAELRKDATDLFMNAWHDTPERQAAVLNECARLNAYARAIDASNGVIDECPF